MDLLMFLIVLLLVVWLLGAFAFPVAIGMGNLVHVLLLLVVVLIIFKLVQGRNVV